MTPTQQEIIEAREWFSEMDDQSPEFGFDETDLKHAKIIQALLDAAIATGAEEYIPKDGETFYSASVHGNVYAYRVAEMKKYGGPIYPVFRTYAECENFVNTLTKKDKS